MKTRATWAGSTHLWGHNTARSAESSCFGRDILSSQDRGVTRDKPAEHGDKACPCLGSCCQLGFGDRLCDTPKLIGITEHPCSAPAGSSGVEGWDVQEKPSWEAWSSQPLCHHVIVLCGEKGGAGGCAPPGLHGGRDREGSVFDWGLPG